MMLLREYAVFGVMCWGCGASNALECSTHTRNKYLKRAFRVVMFSFRLC